MEHFFDSLNWKIEKILHEDYWIGQNFDSFSFEVSESDNFDFPRKSWRQKRKYQVKIWHVIYFSEID